MNDIVMFKGKVIFVNDDDKKQDMHKLSIQIDVLKKQELQTMGVSTKEYVDKEHDHTYDLAKVNVFDSTLIYDKDSEFHFKDKPLKYGDEVTVKAKVTEYEFRGNRGYTLRLLGLFVNSYARRGGFTDEELAQLRG